MAEADRCTERIIVSDVIWAFDPKKQTIYGWAAPGYTAVGSGQVVSRFRPT